MSGLHVINSDDSKVSKYRVLLDVYTTSKKMRRTEASVPRVQVAYHHMSWLW
jgi:hypothetical protein